jgi:adhesin transport system membrane fusion protein
MLRLANRGGPHAGRDDSRSNPIYLEAKEKWLALSAQAARLRAEANDLPIEFSKEVLLEPEIAARERHTFEIRKRTLTDQVAAMKRSLATIDREMTLVSSLVKQRVISEVDLLRLQRQKADLEGAHLDERVYLLVKRVY